MHGLVRLQTRSLRQVTLKDLRQIIVKTTAYRCAYWTDEATMTLHFPTGTTQTGTKAALFTIV
jgi:hypothetical protein